MGVRGLLARPASFVATLSIALGVGVTAAVALAIRVFAHFGDWLYPTLDERLALLGFLVSAAAVLALAGGVGLWLALRALAPLVAIAGRRWLLVALGLSCLGWLQSPLRVPESSLYANRLNVAFLGFGLVLAAELGRGRHPWRRGAVLALVTTGLALAAACAWLNLVYLLGAPIATRNRLNVALWLASLLLAGLGVAAGSRGIPARAPRAPRAPRYALAVAGILAALSAAPLYRMALAASEPPTAAVPAVSAAPTSTPSGKVLNVVLISIDTLRADHMGIYGYEKNTTPHLDRFFAEAAVFTHMYAQSPWTLPSHVSMLTGLYPSTHGVRYGAAQTSGDIFPMPESAVTVAEILRDAGHATAAFTGGSFISPSYGFEQGFERFDAVRSSRMREVVVRALAWLKDHHTQPFFLFLHSFDVHAYKPLQVFAELGDDGYDGPLRGRRDLAARAGPDNLDSPTPADIAYLEHLYDNELRGTDRDLRRIFAALGQLGRLGDTAVVLTSDHGEEFMEHGRTGHAFSLVEALLRVPLLVSAPGLRRPMWISEPVQTIDIAPTILALAGVRPPQSVEMQGVSLLPLLRGEPHRGALLLFEADALNRQAALVEGRHKYVHHGVPGHNLLDPLFLRLTLRALLTPRPGEELYDLAADPGELRNLAAHEPALAARYRERLFAQLGAVRGAAPYRVTGGVPPTPELAEQLRGLGYLD